MKADEPRAPIVKYGMATDETGRIVARHFGIAIEQQQIAGGVLDHNLRFACIAKALLDGQPAPEAPAPAALPVVSVVTGSDLRAQLGLT